MNELIKSESIIPSTAVILSTTGKKHWSKDTNLTLTDVLLNGRYEVEFSSVDSHGNYPHLNETCAFIKDIESGEERSEIVGSADMNIYDFLVSAGYEVSYALDNTDQKELS